METQTRLSRHNKFISAENIIAIFSVSSDDSLHALSCCRVAKLYGCHYLTWLFLGQTKCGMIWRERNICDRAII